ncbi:MAG: EamA family transporter [Candidatus Marinimicrobia bacterium]|jgi:drug/metabolite transporter (DMT)-like permease|nr:EamA family transporter [Candidatus Neomarinimicrobiota bacterium]MBT3575218.1 EamA family transporter [Candidatus Neomarinimicrobiota bacterium]MBT3680850.1 EamA family transporter [Candidatus Neomarinimicrobiota bacterium]MBT3951388.1 EamA family transporter [Candidatus Neomarinimicrobiota bacterium]MBT4252820.1 EamA family transporter [Candidatus Neomarinimicrobiota bacterium]
MSSYIVPFLYITLVLIWGSTWIAIKVSVGDTPFLMASIRFLLAGLVLVLFQKWRKRPILPRREDRHVILTLGIGNFFFGYGLTYWGMQFVDSNITSILWATLPVMIAVFAHRMLVNEKINASSIFSLVGSIIGTLFIFDLKGADFDPQTAKGMVVILLSILAAAYPNVLFKREGNNLDPVAANASAMLIGATLLLITGLIVEPWEHVVLDVVTVGATAYLAIFGSAIGFTMYFWLVKRVPIVKMSYTTFLIPILASIWGWVLLGEELSSAALTGAVIIILSVSMPEILRKRVFNSNAD